MSGDTPARRVLLVEGNDDKHVVEHLCRRNQNDIPELEIIPKQGIDRLLDGISLEVKTQDREVVGILVDANDDLNARWEAIQDRLTQTDITPPKELKPEGTIIEGRPRIGIWIMPDNCSDGELENFVEKLLPANDPVWPLAKCYIDGIPSCDRKFKSGKIQRAKIHAWLATREEPRKMGAAIGVGDLDATAQIAKKFIKWLQRLFS